MESKWFCPGHVAIGEELEQTIDISVAVLKRDIFESVKARVITAAAKEGNR